MFVLLRRTLYITNILFQKELHGYYVTRKKKFWNIWIIDKPGRSILIEVLKLVDLYARAKCFSMDKICSEHR